MGSIFILRIILSISQRARLSAAEIATLVNNYRREIEKNATDQGVWQDATTFFVTASKS